MKVDDKVTHYFQRIKQVFLYITDKCDLICKQCLYKPNLILEREISVETATQLLGYFSSLGAKKLTLLGGEVSLYDVDNDNQKLFELLYFARGNGYEYIRLDTNGHFESSFLDGLTNAEIDEISFSIDGYDEITNDLLRGSGAFKRTFGNLTEAVKKGLNVHVTSCVTKQAVNEVGSILSFLEKMISFCIENCVRAVNFHGVFEMGVPMDTWTGGTHIDPLEWREAARIIGKKIEAGEYSINVRLPLHVIERKVFESNEKYYGYCPCKLGERALIHPDGNIRVCSSLLSTTYGVALFNENSIIWNDYNNELYNHKPNVHTPCTNQAKMNIGSLVPVCFSIKPSQKEYVWEKMIADNQINERGCFYGSRN